MNEGLKSTIGLIVKVLIILMLPLLFLRYVDTQPTAVVDDHDDEGTRSVAIVNEDTGVEKGKETMILGKEIPSLLGEQEDYSWKVVNRSAAEQGFSNQKYDAIIYVPSSFSENIMTFKEDEPTKAAINYVIQPNLEAKERQRVHREMANAKNKINQEMSTIYWSYVSQEIGNIREHFDTVLEKEVAFQDAMYSFYTPSSKTLATEIEQHKGSLENILNQTDQINDVSNNSVSSAAEAESKMVQFTEALEAYKEAQQEQQQLLAAAQTENKEAIQAGVESYKEGLARNAEQIEQQMKAYKSPVYVQDENKDAIIKRFSSINEQLDEGKESLDEWNENKDQDKDEDELIRKQFLSMNETLLKVYNERLYGEAKTGVLEGISKLEDPKSDIPPNDIDKPNEDDKPKNDYQLNLEDLNNRVFLLKEAIKDVKLITDKPINIPKSAPSVKTEPKTTVESIEEGTKEGTEDKIEEETEDGTENGAEKDENEDEETDEPELDPTPPPEPTDPPEISINWKEVNTGLEELDKSIKKLDEKNGQNVKDIFDSWEEYTDQWEKAYQELEKVKHKVSTPLIEHIISQQNEILGSNLLPGEEKEVLDNEFPDYEAMNNKQIEILSAYSGDLAVLKANLVQKGKIVEENNIVLNLLSDKRMQKEINKLLELDSEFDSKIDSPYTKQLQGVFGNLLGEAESVGEMAKLEENFKTLLAETEAFLNEYDALVQEEQSEIMEKLQNMKLSSEETTTQLQTVNAETFEWEESPSIQFLDGQMVFNIQKSAVSNLDQLSEMVASLDESQGNITSNTEELQSKVSNVQKQSDELNNRWSVNVASTEKVKDDVYDVLGNTVVDGQMNPFVYNYLSNPVEVEGQVNGKVLSETEDRMPPVIMFIIILISGLLIGFLCNYYSNNAYIVQGGLFLLLNLAVGLIISMYGLSIYSLDDGQAIMWSVFTILLLLACSNIVRAGLFIGPFVGWLASIAMIVFFITPLLNIVVPEFSFNNPISNVYMGLQYGTQSSLTWTLIVLAVIVLLASAFVYTLQIMKNRAKVEPNEEKAS